MNSELFDSESSRCYARTLDGTDSLYRRHKVNVGMFDHQPRKQCVLCGWWLEPIRKTQ